jgi:hypothetical protein
MATTQSGVQKPSWIWRWPVFFVLCIPVSIGCWLDFQRQGRVCAYAETRAICTSSAAATGDRGSDQPARPRPTDVSDAAIPVDTPMVAIQRIMYVSSAGLNMRPGPGVEYEPPILKLSQYEAVIVLDEQHQTGESVWVRIEARSKTGWVNSKFLQESVP